MADVYDFDKFSKAIVAATVKLRALDASLPRLEAQFAAIEKGFAARKSAEAQLLEAWFRLESENV